MVARSDRWIAVTGAAVVAAGVALGVLRAALTEPPWRGIDAVAAAVALGGLVAAPGVLVLIAAARDRPALLPAAGLALVPMSFLSFAGLTLPLFAAAVVLWVASARRSARIPATTMLATTAVVPSLLVGAFVALFLTTDPRSFETATGGGSTSDVVTVGEASLSIALSVAAVVAGWVVSGTDAPMSSRRPRRRTS